MAIATLIRDDLRAWVDLAREKVAGGSLGQQDLDVLVSLIDEVLTSYRALVLFSAEPRLDGRVVAWANPDEPDPPSLPEQQPYATVAAALADGWQLVSAPQYRPDAGGTALLGFEYVLQREA